MGLLSERDGVRPYIIPEDKTSKYVVILISILLIIICWSFYVYIATSGITQTVYFGTCQPGQCATNLSTGEKRCSADPNEPLFYSQTRETCNSQYVCDNPLTPYALQSDGSTDANGVCEDGVACRCVKTQSCPVYSTTLFQMTNGSEYTGTKYSVTQIPVVDNGSYGTVAPTLNNNNTQFCKINTSTLNALTPNACAFAGNPSLNDVYNCVSNNFCTVGVPAYIVEGKPTTSFLPDIDFAYYPLTCVLGEQCPAKTLPVWNKQISSVICVACPNCDL